MPTIKRNIQVGFVNKYCPQPKTNSKKNYFKALIKGLGITRDNYAEYKSKHGDFVVTLLPTKSHMTSVFVDLSHQNYDSFISSMPLMLFDSSHATFSKANAPTSLMLNFVKEKQENLDDLLTDEQVIEKFRVYVRGLTDEKILEILAQGDKEKIKSKIQVEPDKYQEDTEDKKILKYVRNEIENPKIVEFFDYPKAFGESYQGKIQLVNPRLQSTSSCVLHAIAAAKTAISCENIASLKEKLMASGLHSDYIERIKPSMSVKDIGGHSQFLKEYMQNMLDLFKNDTLDFCDSKFTEILPEIKTIIERDFAITAKSDGDILESISKAKTTGELSAKIAAIKDEEKKLQVFKTALGVIYEKRLKLFCRDDAIVAFVPRLAEETARRRIEATLKQRTQKAQRGIQQAV